MINYEITLLVTFYWHTPAVSALKAVSFDFEFNLQRGIFTLRTAILTLRVVSPGDVEFHFRLSFLKGQKVN